MVQVASKFYFILAEIWPSMLVSLNLTSCPVADLETITALQEIARREPVKETSHIPQTENVDAVIGT